MNIQTVNSSNKKLIMHYYDEVISGCVSKRYVLCHTKESNPKRFLLEIFNFLNPQYGVWNFYQGSGGFVLPKDPPLPLGINNREFIIFYDVDYSKASNDLYDTVDDILNGASTLNMTIIHPALKPHLVNGEMEVKTETVKVCNHQWVNFGFNSIRYCCKHCGIDKPDAI